MDDDGQMKVEDVGLNYRNNYMKIIAPAMDEKTQAIVMYDVTVVLIASVFVYN